MKAWPNMEIKVCLHMKYVMQAHEANSRLHALSGFEPCRRGFQIQSSHWKVIKPDPFANNPSDEEPASSEEAIGTNSQAVRMLGNPP